MRREIKKVAAIHDFSCAGRCSLTAALPVLSACGIEVNGIPTAVLSTQTGGFTDYTYQDLSAELLPVADHWKKLGRCFDAIYTGFIGSKEQLSQVAEAVNRLKTPDTLIAVDPVMGEDGALYGPLSAPFVAAMRDFCRGADLITPNVTEAFLLLDEPYREGPYTERFALSVTERLAELGPDTVVLTGIPLAGDRIGAAMAERRTGVSEILCTERIPGTFHGAGDVFASALLGFLLNGKPAKEALAAAMRFVSACVRDTADTEADPRYGLLFEPNLPLLFPKGTGRA